MKEITALNLYTEVLVDISDVHLDKTLPPTERLEKYLKDIKNPYRFLCNGNTITVNFIGKNTLDNILKNYFIKQK